MNRRQCGSANSIFRLLNGVALTATLLVVNAWAQNPVPHPTKADLAFVPANENRRAETELEHKAIARDPFISFTRPLEAAKII